MQVRTGPVQFEKDVFGLGAFLEDDTRKRDRDDVDGETSSNKRQR